MLSNNILEKCTCSNPNSIIASFRLQNTVQVCVFLKDNRKDNRKNGALLGRTIEVGYSLNRRGLNHTSASCVLLSKSFWLLFHFISSFYLHETPIGQTVLKGALLNCIINRGADLK